MAYPDQEYKRRGRLVVSVISVMLALVLDVIAIAFMVSDQWIEGLALCQMATFLVLFAIWVDG